MATIIAATDIAQCFWAAVQKKSCEPCAKGVSSIRTRLTCPTREEKNISAAVSSMEKTSYLAHIGRSGEVQSLRCHLLQVSAISARLAAKIGMKRAGELIGLTHDLGKYSQAF